MVRNIQLWLWSVMIRDNLWLVKVSYVRDGQLWLHGKLWLGMVSYDLGWSVMVRDGQL